MNRRVLFRPAAERELLQAERWFEERQAELGRRFRDSVDATIERIRQFPLAFPAVHGDKRRAIVPHFPYGLYFRLIDDQIVIAGVVHGRRDPAVWQSRR
jgi:plasmid stabilization system protein ParE